jgi:hypothetical protein
MAAKAPSDGVDPVPDGICDGRGVDDSGEADRDTVVRTSTDRVIVRAARLCRADANTVAVPASPVVTG